MQMISSVKTNFVFQFPVLPGGYRSLIMSVYYNAQMRCRSIVSHIYPRYIENTRSDLMLIFFLCLISRQAIEHTNNNIRRRY